MIRKQQYCKVQGSNVKLAQFDSDVILASRLVQFKFVLRTDHRHPYTTTNDFMPIYIPRLLLLLKDQPRGGTSIRHKLAWPYLIHQRSKSWMGTTNPATSSHNIVSTHQHDCHLLVPLQLQTFTGIFQIRYLSPLMSGLLPTFYTAI